MRKPLTFPAQEGHYFTYGVRLSQRGGHWVCEVYEWQMRPWAPMSTIGWVRSRVYCGSKEVAQEYIPVDYDEESAREAAIQGAWKQRAAKAENARRGLLDIAAAMI